MAKFLMKSLCIVLIVAFLLCAITGCSAEDTTYKTDRKYFTWVKEESTLVNIRVVDNTVYLYYSIYFDNQYDHEVDVWAITVRFSRYSLRGWLKYQKVFVGDPVDGSTKVTIPPSTKTSVVFVFQGEYLGGKINEKLRIRGLAHLVDYHPKRQEGQGDSFA